MWPAPSSDFRDAIAGLRTETARPRLARLRDAPPDAGDTVAALLLEGRVGPARMRALLASGGPREWIAESPGHVELPSRWADRLARAGVRWSALEPVELVALTPRPALARACSAGGDGSAAAADARRGQAVFQTLRADEDPEEAGVDGSTAGQGREDCERLLAGDRALYGRPREASASNMSRSCSIRTGTGMCSAVSRRG